MGCSTSTLSSNGDNNLHEKSNYQTGPVGKIDSPRPGLPTNSTHHNFDVNVHDSEKDRDATGEEPRVGLPEGDIGDCLLGITVIIT